MSKLTYIEKCSCENNRFCSFVHNSNRFSEMEKDHLIKSILDDQFTGILYVSGVLAIWSVVAGIIDAVLFPGIIAYAIFHGVIDYKVITPPLVFLVGNILLKLSYIYKKLNGKAGFYDILIAALPYAGSAYLLKKILVNDRLMTKAVGLYIAKKKTNFRSKLIRSFTPK